uniref:Facilitated trehalose transporter Tret1 n=2 Tax=Schizaphis graminum TaxID=13262 RepID=A0A2S2NFQ1_SCHGA
MVKYNMPSNNDEPHDIENINTWKQFFEPAVLRPFRLLMMYFFFKILLSGLPLVPYLVSVFNKFGAPVNVEWSISFSMFLSMIGSLSAVFLIPKLGKRFLTLFTLSVCSICYIIIGLIGMYWKNAESITSWTILVLYLTTIFISSTGITPIMWALIPEIFPAKYKNILFNISSACFFVMAFFMTKYYPEFSNAVEFYNAFTICGIFGLFGCIYFYFCLPETENKTLQEIAEFFK